MPPKISPQIEITEQKITITTKEMLFIEALSVFLIVSLTMFLTIWQDIVQKNYSQFNYGLLGAIVNTAFIRTLLFILGYSVVRKLYSLVGQGLNKAAIFIEQINKKQLIIVHIFAAVVLIFSCSSVRPVIQRPLFSEDFTAINNVSVGFTNYDFSHTLIGVGIFTVLAIFLFVVFNTRLQKKDMVGISMLFVIFSILCSLNNYQDSFNEKILEARGHLNMTQEVGDHSTNSQEESLYQYRVGEEVFSLANQALSLAKTDSEKALALRWIASGLQLQMKSEQAFETINQSIELDPQDYSYGELTYIAIDLKKYKVAIDAATKCLSLNPEAFYCYAPLAKAEWFMGDYEKSKETLQKGISFSPNSKIFHDLLSYYEVNIPIELSYYTPEQRELRKNNEPVNICLSEVEEKYYELAQSQCLLEGKNQYCGDITPEHGQELLTKTGQLRQECFTQFAGAR